MYDTGYPKEPVSGRNPYWRCVHCKRTDPDINGDIKRHESWCKYRMEKENSGKTMH